MTFSTSIAEIGQLDLTNKVVQMAVTEAQATDHEIEVLAAAAQKIGDVVKLIRDIAGQTNPQTCAPRSRISWPKWSHESRGRYSGFRPAALMIGHHFSISAF
jgi:hypothetical protein